MDKRYKTVSIPQQLQLRKQAVANVLAHPEWSLPDAVRHLKKTTRLTSVELSRLSGVSYRTVQDIEQGRSEGNVQTLNRILGILGLKLGVARIERPGTDAFDDAETGASPSLRIPTGGPV